MAFGDIVQSASAAGYPVTSVTVNISAAVAGNLLVCCHFTGAASSNAPATYTESVVINDGGNNDEMAIYHLIAVGGETTVIPGSSASDDNVAVVVEIEGPWESSPVDATATNDATSESSTSSGTTGTTSQDDEVAVVANSMRNAATDRGTWTNSFVKPTSNEVASTYKSIGMATKLLTGTGTVESTVSHTSAVSMGCVVTYKKEGVGGGVSIPIVGYHHRRRN